MKQHQQHTLVQSVSVSGVGLHTGKRTQVQLHPAAVDHGIVFVRTDVDDFAPLKARPEIVLDTQLASTIGHPESTLDAKRARISTVEHLMSALCGLRVDNALVAIDGPELPILDGSAAAFRGGCLAG